MPLPENLTSGQWRNLLDRMDLRISDAIEDFVRAKFYGAGDLAAGFSELYKLRGGREPDYCLPGIAVAYAFKYLPQRVTCLVATLLQAAGQRTPSAILDVGSGSDAVSLALELLAPEDVMSSVTLEFSPEMQEFGGYLLQGQWERQRVTGDYHDLIGGGLQVGLGLFDLVTLSAAAPYGAARCGELAATISKLTSPPALIIAVEPERKARQLEELRAGFAESSFYQIEDYCCHQLTENLRIPRLLPRLTTLLRGYVPHIYKNPRLTEGGRRMIGDPPFDITSWNTLSSYKELAILCFEEGLVVPEEDDLLP